MKTADNKSKFISNGVKIISGLYKGANLFSPVGVDIRPALARMKNSLFNILAWQLEGKNVLDLFAGTGSLGLEALSRGARHCLFIDNQRACIDAIQKSIAKLKLESRAKAVLMDSFNIVSYVLRAGERFDYIFIDPPYKYYDPVRSEDSEREKSADDSVPVILNASNGAGELSPREKLFGVITDIAEQKVMAKGGILIVEHRSNKRDEDALNNPGQLERFDLRNYGQTSLSFLRMKRSTTDSADCTD